MLGDDLEWVLIIICIGIAGIWACVTYDHVDYTTYNLSVSVLEKHKAGIGYSMDVIDGTAIMYNVPCTYTIYNMSHKFDTVTLQVDKGNSALSTLRNFRIV